MRRARKPPPPPQATEMATEIENRQPDSNDDDDGKGCFFACYLLCSRIPRHKGHTYIGFTVNLRRRIRHHNGEIRSGAWRTKRGRPWEMILCIYGFPTNVAALQFEWAWQHPTESLAVRKAASNFKSLSGIDNKIKLAYTMLSLPAWENLNLTVNFFSTKYKMHTAVCPRLPKQMRVNVCVMDDLPCYIEGQFLNENCYDDYDEDTEDERDNENMNETMKPVEGLCSSESPRHGDECNGISSDDQIQENSYSCQPPCDGLDWNAYENFRDRMESEEPYCFDESPKPSEEMKEIPFIESPTMVEDSLHLKTSCDDGVSQMMILDDSGPRGYFDESPKPSEEIKEIPFIESSTMVEDNLHLKTSCDDGVSQMTILNDSGPRGYFDSWRRVKSVNRRTDCSKISETNELRQSRNRNSNNMEREVIDLLTPFRSKNRARTKKASDIIDLTDSPVIIDL